MCFVQLDSLLVHLSSLWSSCVVTIDRSAKYRISGASVTPARNTGTNKYPTAPDASNNVTNDYSTSVLAGDLSPR